MQRYFISNENFLENIIIGNDVFHIYKVMRNKPNDLIEVCCDNKAYLAKIVEISSEFVKFEVVNEIKHKDQNKPKITLIQGLAKGDKNEEIIKHGTELGVDTIYLLQMDRSIVKIESKKVDSKLERYRKIAKEAAEQSHRNTIPEIFIINNLKEIDFSVYDIKLLLDEEEAKKPDGTLLCDVSVEGHDIIFVVGPEGGISDNERNKLLLNNFIPVSIGNNILRTETASLSFLAMLNYIFLKG